MNFSTSEHLIFKSLCAFIQEQAGCGQVSLRATYRQRLARDGCGIIRASSLRRRGMNSGLCHFGQVELSVCEGGGDISLVSCLVP